MKKEYSLFISGILCLSSFFSHSTLYSEIYEICPDPIAEPSQNFENPLPNELSNEILNDPLPDIPPGDSKELLDDLSSDARSAAAELSAIPPVETVFPGPNMPDLNDIDPFNNPNYKYFQPITLSEAIQTTIDRQLQIKIAQMNVYFQRGVIQQAAGPFDPVVTDNYDARYTFDQQIPFSIKSNVEAQAYHNFINVVKLTRIGTIFTLQSDVNKFHNPLLFFLGSYPRSRVSSGDVVLRIDQALLRGGLGESIQTQQELADIRQLDAVKYDVLQTIADAVLNTILSYWDFVAAIKALKIQQNAVKRFEILMEKMQLLIDAKEAAATDILQVQANLASQKQSEIAASFELYRTMQHLLFSMGALDVDVEYCRDMDFDQIVGAYLEYPEVIKDVKYIQDITDPSINYAFMERFDIQAALINEEVSATILRGLYNQTLPQVNLFGQMRRSDFKVGKREARPLTSSLYFKRPQLDWSLGVNVSFPAFNDAAIGAYKQGAATLQQNILQTYYLKEQAVQNILTTLKNQMDLTFQIYEADKAVLYYEGVVAAETKKLNAGFTTLFELISYVNSLSSALLVQNSLYAQNAANIATLRFYIGVLVRIDEARHFVVEDIESLPSLEFLRLATKKFKGRNCR